MSKPAKPKSLGQIAYESLRYSTGWVWLQDYEKDMYLRIARAVEREVLRRLDHVAYWKKVCKIHLQKPRKSK